MAIPTASRRSLAPAPAAPPPQEEPEQTLFNYILSCITTVDPDFKPQQQHETDERYLTRICAFLSIPDEGDTSIHMPDETWQAMIEDAPDAEAWYAAASEAITNRQAVPAPEGFYETEEAPAEPEPPPPAPAPRAVPPRGAAARQPGPAQANGQHAPAAIPRRGPPPAPAQAAPARRGVPAAAPAAPPQVPARRPVATAAPAPAPGGRRAAPAAAPAQAEAPKRQINDGIKRWQEEVKAQKAAGTYVPRPRATSAVSDDLMAQGVYYPTMTNESLAEYARQRGYDQKDSTISAILSRVRTHLDLFDRLGIVDHTALAKLQAGG